MCTNTPSEREALCPVGFQRQVHLRYIEAIALQGLGEAHARMGKSEDGAAYLREALGIFRRLGMPAAEHVTKRLAEIGSLLAAFTGPL